MTLAAACGDNFLTGGELTNDPNRPTQATSAQLFVGIEVNDLGRAVERPGSRLEPVDAAAARREHLYVDTYHYGVSEGTTNGFQAALYTGGGLIDIRRLEQQTAAAHDSVFHGVAEVMEALMIGTGADLVRRHHLHARPHQRTESAARPTARGLRLGAGAAVARHRRPGSDRPDERRPRRRRSRVRRQRREVDKLAHTLKARFLMHTARGAADGLCAGRVGGEGGHRPTPADNFNAVFSGEHERAEFLVSVRDRAAARLHRAQTRSSSRCSQSRNDPRLATYFNADQSDLSDALLSPTAPQPLVTANESLLLWAEGLQRSGNDAGALVRLNQARALVGLPAEQRAVRDARCSRRSSSKSTSRTSRASRRGISTSAPARRTSRRWSRAGRFRRDSRTTASERNTNTNIPPLSAQPARNANDPANATSDATGAACLGQ